MTSDTADKGKNGIDPRKREIKHYSSLSNRTPQRKQHTARLVPVIATFIS